MSLKKLVSDKDMDWEIVLKEDIPNVNEDTTVDPSPKDIDMEKHEESVDQRENDLETYDVTKDIRVKDEVGDKNHEELNILHTFKIKEGNNVQDSEDDIEIKEEEVLYDSESGSDSDLEIDPLRLSPMKNDDRHVEARFVLPFSPKKVADLWSDASTSDTESAPTDKDSDFSEESKSETDMDGGDNVEDLSASRGSGLRSGRRSVTGTARPQDENDWSEDPALPNLLPFTALPGLLCAVPYTPLQFFQLFFTRSLLHHITTQTNVYANFRKPNMHIFGLRDIAQFLGVRMFMGMVKLASEYEYWENSIFGQSKVKTVMSWQHYRNISSYFFDCRNVPADNNDRISFIRPIVEYFQHKCKALYTPLVNLSLEEGLIPFNDRLGMKVYNRMKPDKYGIKIYYLCEARSGYVCDFSIYQGVSSTLRDTVLSLLQRHFHLGYRVFMDNYHNSVALSEELYDNGTLSCGTLHLPRGAPSVLCNLAKKKVPRNELNFRRKGNVFVICWQDTRLVTMISTMHNAETEPYVHTERVKKQGKFTRTEVRLDRPVAIGEYSKYMQGVDRLDQMIKYYNFDCRSIKWTKKAFFYFLELMVVNSHILYQKYTTDVKKMNLLNFHKAICLALMNYDDNEWPHGNDGVFFPPPYGSPHVQAPVTPPIPSTSGMSAAKVPPAEEPAATSDNEMEENESPKPKPKNFRLPDSKYRLLDIGKGGFQHKPDSIGKRRKRCRVCSRNGVRKDTAYVCHACGGMPLCITGHCFLAYHKKEIYWSEGGSKE